jgi:S-adenosylmethionine-dependent methyltransferase
MGHPSGPASPRTHHRALDAFDARAAAWEDYTATPLGRLREELTTRFLMRHVDPPPPALDVLDVGGGTGGYALALARAGHWVCLLDFSPAMLEIARHKARNLGPEMSARIEVRCAAVQDLPRLFSPGRFDLVLCHTLLEYIAEPWEALEAMGGVLRPGGLLSVLTVNRRADPLRRAIAKGDLEGALQALAEEVSPADLFDLPRRTLTTEWVEEALGEVGVDVEARYGVRVLADYLSAKRLDEAEFWDRLLELESAIGTLDPYRPIARYSLFVGRKHPAEERSHRQVAKVAKKTERS